MHRTIKATALFLSLVGLSACATNPPPVVTPQPPPPVASLPVHVVIHDAAGQVPQNIRGAIGVTACTPLSFFMLSCDLAPGVPYGTTVGVRFEGDGSDPFVAELAAAADLNVVLPAKPLPVALADEHGWLRRDGLKVLDEDGRVWRQKGTTAFQLLRQACAGENIQPFINDQVAQGAREFRVFGMFDPWIGTFTLARDDLPTYDACLLGLTRTLAAQHLRLFYTVFADAQNVMPATSDQQRFLAHVAALLADEWNARGELCNECAKNGVDPSQFQKPAVRPLWSRGSGLAATDPSAPAWDFADYHEARDDEYPRKNECRPYMDDGGSPIRGVPCFQSEPMGAAEIDQPGKRAGAINGDASQAVRDFGQMGANFGLQGPGGVFHSDAGITGDLMGPVQRQMAAAFFRGLNFPPTDAYLAPYQRGDNCGECEAVGGMPLAQRDLPGANGTLRTFCRPVNRQEYCVEVRRKGGAPQSRAGWRIVDEPGPGLVRLER